MADIRDVYLCLRALANERRLRIVMALAQRHHTVSELSTLLACSEPATSKHLQKLRSCHMVSRKQIGMEASYALVRSEPFTRIMLGMLKR